MTAPRLSSPDGDQCCRRYKRPGGRLLRSEGTSRNILRACLKGHFHPIAGAALVTECEDVIARDAMFVNSPFDLSARNESLDGFLPRRRWTEVFFGWCPNLPDEADNHLMELAIAGGAAVIVSRNLRDLTRGELRFDSLRILTPEQCLKEYPCPL